MFLRLAYKDVQGSSVRGFINEKKYNFLMRVVVDETNIEEAIVKLGHSKDVVAFDYVGDVSALPSLHIGEALVLVEKEVNSPDEKIHTILSSIDPKVRVVFKLPSTYSDMRMLQALTQSLEGVRSVAFEGGHFLHIQGVSIGAIQEGDIPRKIADRRRTIVSMGMSSVYDTVGLEVVEKLEFYEKKVSTPKPKKEKPVKETKDLTIDEQFTAILGGDAEEVEVVKEKKQKKKASAPKSKKKVSSLVAVAVTDGLDNF